MCMLLCIIIVLIMSMSGQREKRIAAESKEYDVKVHMELETWHLLSPYSLCGRHSSILQIYCQITQDDATRKMAQRAGKTVGVNCGT